MYLFWNTQFSLQYYLLTYDEQNWVRVGECGAELPENVPWLVALLEMKATFFGTFPALEGAKF